MLNWKHSLRGIADSHNVIPQSKALKKKKTSSMAKREAFVLIFFSWFFFWKWSILCNWPNIDQRLLSLGDTSWPRHCLTAPGLFFCSSSHPTLSRILLLPRLPCFLAFGQEVVVGFFILPRLTEPQLFSPLQAVSNTAATSDWVIWL